MLAFFLCKNSSVPPSVVRQQRASGITFIAFNLMNGFSHAGIDNAAHVGGLAVGLAMGFVLARPLGTEAWAKINAASFYVRGSAVALMIVAILFAAVHLSPTNNPAEQAFRRDLVAMREPEEHARKAANDAMTQLQNHQITPSEFADRIEADVLPRWTRIRENIARDQVPDDSKMKALWELMDDYSYSRLAAFRLFDSGSRNGDNCRFQASAIKTRSRRE
jgi:rhomboid protease GluP